MKRDRILSHDTPVGDFASLLKTAQKVQSVTPMRQKDRPLTPSEQAKKAYDKAKVDGYDDGYGDGLNYGKKEGFEAGFAEGKSLAYAEYQEKCAIEIKQFIDELNAIYDRVQDATDRWKEECEADVVEIALNAVERVLASELNLSRDSALAIAREALNEVTHSSKARIRLNPFDLPIIEQHREALIAASTSLRQIEIISDESIDAGCIVETDGGVIDSRIETRLKLLRGSIEAA
jgi:flagellar biosynthesis/type III secretory pathway protein FliH